MNDVELQLARREKWRLDGHPVRTLEAAREFVESVGFCLLYPLRPPTPVTVTLPTFVGAWVGAEDRLPTWQHAFADPRAAEARELMVRLLREHAAFEANLLEDNNAFLVAPSVFPFLYALLGDRNPRQAPRPGPRSEFSNLACDAFALIRQKGPISRLRLAESLGGSISLVGLDRALGELWSRLRITRVDYNPAEGASWDELLRWAPQEVSEGASLSVPTALTALVSRYLDTMIAADQAEVEGFLGNFVPRSRVREAINALLAARELSFLNVDKRSLVEVTKSRPVPERRPHTGRAHSRTEPHRA